LYKLFLIYSLILKKSKRWGLGIWGLGVWGGGGGGGGPTPPTPPTTKQPQKKNK